MASTTTVRELLAQRTPPSLECVTHIADDATPPDSIDEQQIPQNLEAARIRLEANDYQNCFEYLANAFDDLCKHPLSFSHFYPTFLDSLLTFQNVLIEHQHFDAMGQWICSLQQQGLSKRIVNHFERGDLPSSLAEQTVELLLKGFVGISGEELDHLQLKKCYLLRCYHLAKRYGLANHQVATLEELGKLSIRIGELLPENRCFIDGFQLASVYFNVVLTLDPTKKNHLSEVERMYLERFAPEWSTIQSGVARLLNNSNERTAPIHLSAATDVAELILEYGRHAQAITLYNTLVKRAKHKKYSQATIDGLRNRHIELAPAVPAISSFYWEKNRQILAGIRNLTTFLFHHRIHSLPQSPTFEMPEEFLEITLNALHECGITAQALERLDGLEGHLAPYTIHQLQRFLGTLTIKFSEMLYLRACLLLGAPPCKFALLGLGSLARGEMSIHSDLDAVVLVERRSEAIVKYFTEVGYLFDLMVGNLGETECLINGMKHLRNGFCLDIAALHPAKTIETSERLIALQEQEGRELARGSDMDPTRNAMRLSCFITGDLDLFESYTTSLYAYFAEGAAELIGSHLLTNLRWPETFRTSFNAKNDLYRPITLFIDALSVKYNIEAYETTTRIELLRERNILSPELALLCERALHLACRLRLHAQIYYGEESETIYLDASANPDETPLLLSYEDYQTLREIQYLLLDPLSKMKLSQGISDEELNEGKIRLARIYTEEQEPQEAKELLTNVIPPTELIVKIALLEGSLEIAARAIYHEKRKSYTPSDQELGKHIAWLASLPDTLDLSLFTRLTSILYFYKSRIGEHNTKIPQIDLDVIRARIIELSSQEELTQPQQKELERAQFILKQQILIFLRELEKKALSGEMKAFLWRSKEEYLLEIRPLPHSYEQLIQELLHASTDRKNQTTSIIELLYADILELLDTIQVPKEFEKVIYKYLYHHLPKSLRPYFLARLEAWGTSPLLIHLLRNFPEPNGYRPMVTEEQEAWIASCGNHPPYTESSPCHLIGVETSHSNLDEGLREFLLELLNQPPQGVGRHRVGKYRGIYYKISPEFPGRQFAVNLLTKLIAGRGTPPQNLLRITFHNRSFYVLASKEVIGPTLQEVLDNQPELLERIDHKQFCEMVLLSLFINPEDAKPDNFVVEGTEGNGSLRVICIDPDRVFVKSMKKRWHGRSSDVQVKNVLYCMDQMLRPFDADFREEFLALEPAAILDNWLQQIEIYNDRCRAYFGDEAINHELTKSYRSPAMDKKGSEIPFFLEPTTLRQNVIQHKGLLLKIYDRFAALQYWLRDHPNSRCIDLLENLEGGLYERYQPQLGSDRSILQRFDCVAEGQYKKVGTASVTKTNLKGRYRTLQEYERHGWTCARARLDLNNIIIARKTAKEVAEDLLRGEWSVLSVLKSLNLPEVSDAVFKEIDFSTLSISYQKELIGQMQGLSFTKLCLAGCEVLSDSSLELILQHCPQLTLLDLSNTRGVRNMTYIARHCPRIVKLSLENIPSLKNLSGDNFFTKGTMRLDDLRTLNLGHCPRLTRVSLVIPPLKTLKIRGSHLPRDWQIDCKQLEILITDSEPIFRRLRSRFTSAKLIADLPFNELTNLIAIFCGDEGGNSTFCTAYGEKKPADLFGQIDKQCLVGDFSLTTPGPYGCTRALYTCSQIHDEQLMEIIRGNPNITHLHLPRKNLTDRTLIAIVENNHLLADLNISENRQLTDTSITIVAQECTQLSSFSASSCKELTDASIIEIAQRCPQLLSLNISFCGKITDTSITIVARQRPQLLFLNISECYQLTDTSIIEIAQSCTNIVSLNVSRCEKLTDTSIVTLVRRCSRLSLLQIRGCYKLTHSLERTIRSEYPRIDLQV